MYYMALYNYNNLQILLWIFPKKSTDNKRQEGEDKQQIPP